MLITDRIKELRRIPVKDLRPSPRNWRTHPKFQLDALRGAIAEVGYADAALGRELPDGTVELIDGHARAEVLPPDFLMPVLILDVDEAGAAKLLATLDPLASLATADAARLDALLRDIETENDALADMLSQLAQAAEPSRSKTKDDLAAGDEAYTGMPEFRHEDQTADAAFIIRVFLKDADDLAAFGKLLGKDLTGKKFVWFGKQPIGETYEATEEAA